jgi:hypothetical protein
MEQRRFPELQVVARAPGGTEIAPNMHYNHILQVQKADIIFLSVDLPSLQTSVALTARAPATKYTKALT